MKRTAILLCTLLALAAFTHADSIGLTSGSGTLYSLPPASVTGFIFQFHGSGYNFSIPGGLDEAGGVLVNDCVEPCDPLASPVYPPLFTVSAPAFVLVPGDPLLSGGFTFTAVSFVSSIAPTGNLTIRYTTSLSIFLSLIDNTTLLPVAEFVWGSNEPWMVTAHYAPFPAEIPGLYTFEGATFTPVPVPSTLTLLGTGILPISFGVRRRLSRASFRIRVRTNGPRPNFTSAKGTMAVAQTVEKPALFLFTPPLKGRSGKALLAQRSCL